MYLANTYRTTDTDVGLLPRCTIVNNVKAGYLALQEATGLGFGLSATSLPATFTIEPVRSLLLAVP